MMIKIFSTKEEVDCVSCSTSAAASACSLPLLLLLMGNTKQRASS